jgi:glucose-6-phosphate 1-dehydrogenase
VVDGILDDRTPLHDYEPGTWGPDAATAILAHEDRWHDPVIAGDDASPTSPGAAATPGATR